MKREEKTTCAIFGWSKVVMWYCLAIKGLDKYSYTPCYVALPGYRGLEGARLITLRLDNYIRSTGVGTCVEFKIIIRLCLVIKGWTKYSWRVDKGLHLRIMDKYV